MGRYSDITSRAVALVPARFRTPLFRGKALIFGLLAGMAITIVVVGSAAALLGDMIDGTGFTDALPSALWGAVGAGTATALALVLMPFVRDGLGLAEDIRLLRAASPEQMKMFLTRLGIG